MPAQLVKVHARALAARIAIQARGLLQESSITSRDMDFLTGKLDLLRARIGKNRARGFPMPAYQVLWLASEYVELPGSLQPDDTSISAPFETLSPEQKLTKLLSELREAQSLDAQVPTDWAEWLLAEFEKLLAVAGHPRADALP